MTFSSLSLIACATCVQNSQNDVTDAAGWSIFFLLGVILAMLGMVVFFVIRMARRSAAALDPEFQDEAAPAPAPSH
jgi:ABC-type sulfate transport system permease component